jgi:hypothetical protein
MFDIKPWHLVAAVVVVLAVAAVVTLVAIAVRASRR